MSGRSGVSLECVVSTVIIAFCRRSLLRGVAGLERRIGLIDDFEALFGVLVAAIRVRVVELHQRFVARLEIGQRNRLAQIENRQSARLRRCRMAMRRGAVAAGRRLVVVEIEQAVALEPRLVVAERARSEGPAGPLPYRIAPDFAFDVVRRHAGVIIPRRVVGPDVIEAKPQVFVQRGARPWRAKFAHTGATGMVARPPVGRPVRVGMARAYGTWHDVGQYGETVDS